MAEASYDVIVVGAGIIGASTAHFLKKKGVDRVLLIDRGDPASGGTGKSAAIVRSYYSIPVMARLAKEAVKLFHNLENIGEFIADPMGQLMAFSGLTFYGGLIAGAFAVIWYGRKYNIKPLNLADAAAPGLMLAYGVGRIGCQLSGDGDWGVTNLTTKPCRWAGEC